MSWGMRLPDRENRIGKGLGAWIEEAQWPSEHRCEGKEKKLVPRVIAASHSPGGLPSSGTKLLGVSENSCLMAFPKALVRFPRAPAPSCCPAQPPSHLAASPPGLRLETLGFPSLSVPPEMVRPSVLLSFLISSTTVTPRNSSADIRKVRGQHGAIWDPQLQSK